MTKATAVVELLEKTTQSVHEKAVAAFTRDVAAYREAVQAMAESGGTLPEEKADELLEVCQRLGIDATRLSEDATVFIRLRNINARIEAVQARNEARREPLPRLHAAMEEAQAEFSRLRIAYESKVKAADLKATAARRAYESLANQREERADDAYAELREVQSRNPHLFQSMTPDELRRFLAGK
jgi:hypothetical protein